MNRVVFVSELGEGLGHVSRLLPIAKRMKSDGFECIFVVSHYEAAFREVQNAGFLVVPGPPVRMAPLKRGQLAKSLGDIIGRAGFGEFHKLSFNLKAWDSIFHVLAPNLIIMDYAPTARLAAGKKFNTAVVGSPFTIPPINQETLPRFRPGALLYLEKSLMENIDRAQKENQGWIPRKLADLFYADKTFTTFFPQIDRYFTLREEQSIGPLFIPSFFIEKEPDKDLFFYLKRANGPKVLGLINAMRDANLTGEGYLSHVSEKLAKTLSTKKFIISAYKQDIVSALTNKKFVIHHGGVGLAQAAMAIGIPQVILLTHAENHMNGGAL